MKMNLIQQHISTDLTITL